jgi:hypothetical protein
VLEVEAGRLCGWWMRLGDHQHGIAAAQSYPKKIPNFLVNPGGREPRDEVGLGGVDLVSSLH